MDTCVVFAFCRWNDTAANIDKAVRMFSILLCSYLEVDQILYARQEHFK